MRTFTEEEASNHWCRFATTWTWSAEEESRPVTVNRRDHGAADAACMCIGSKCMHWDWYGSLRRIFHTYTDADGSTGRAVEEPPRPLYVAATWVWVAYNEAEGEPPGWLEPEVDARARMLGFCRADHPTFGDHHD